MSPLDGITLAIMARYPEPGRTKTRLTPALSPQQAAGVYRLFLRHLIGRMASLAWAELLICHDPPNCADQMRRILFDVIPEGRARYHAQSPGDLGARLADAARPGARNCPDILFLGVDAPDIPINHLLRAAEWLRSHDLAIGPAEDGGYWTIALRGHVNAKQLFAAIEWSSGRECEQTVAAARRLGYKVGLADRWHDVDRPADLRGLIERLRGSADPRDRHLLGQLDRLGVVGGAEPPCT